MLSLLCTLLNFVTRYQLSRRAGSSEVLLNVLLIIVVGLAVIAIGLREVEIVPAGATFGARGATVMEQRPVFKIELVYDPIDIAVPWALAFRVEYLGLAAGSKP